jgi:hypothetical protein
MAKRIYEIGLDAYRPCQLQRDHAKHGVCVGWPRPDDFHAISRPLEADELLERIEQKKIEKAMAKRTRQKKFNYSVADAECKPIGNMDYWYEAHKNAEPDKVRFSVLTY